jgi:DNA polymerase-3 subunit beta
MRNDPFITRFRQFALATALISVLSGGARCWAAAAAGNDAADHVGVRLRASDLRQGLRRASASIGSAKTAAHDWNRVLLEAGAGSVTLVGTDGRRLTAVDLTGLDPRKAGGPSVATSLSVNAVNMALEVLDGLDGDVLIDVSPDRLAIAQGKVELRLPTAKARFPDWRKVIPKVEDGVAVNVNAGQFLLAVTQAEATSGGERPTASIKLSRNKLAVTAGLADGGPAGSELAVEYGGDDKALGFNPSYLRSFLGLLEKDKAVKMVLHGPRDAILFVTDDGCRFTLMPILRAE